MAAEKDSFFAGGFGGYTSTMQQGIRFALYAYSAGGTGQVQPFMRLGGVDYDMGSPLTLPASNGIVRSAWFNSKPDTGKAFDQQDATGAEFGIRSIDTVAKKIYSFNMEGKNVGAFNLYAAYLMCVVDSTTEA
jgi:hypothetical protein